MCHALAIGNAFPQPFGCNAHNCGDCGGAAAPETNAMIARARFVLPRVLAVVGAAAFGVAIDASAQEREDPIGGGPRKFESPQNFAAEIRFAPFYPAIDSDPALHGATPFKDTFGSAPRLLVSAELDWQAYRIPHLGTIGPGLGVGFSTMSDPAQFQQPHDGQVSGETTTLQILPTYLAAVLRVDVFWREAHVPVVPYAKAGLGLAFWRASNTLGTSRVDGVLGEGDSFGTHVALGVAVNLNQIDPYAATSFDDTMGVNNTYAFAEWTREDLDGLGVQNDPLRVGGTSWNFGLAFEF